MIYVFICPKCRKTHFVSLKRSRNCPECGEKMANCEVDYADWVRMNEKQRRKFIGLYLMEETERLCFCRPMPFYDRRERHYEG